MRDAHSRYPLMALVFALTTALALLSSHCRAQSLTVTQDASGLPPGISTLTISQYFNVTLPPPLSAQQTAQAIDDKYGKTSEADTVRDHLPRFYGSELDIKNDDRRNDWIRGTVYYVIPGCVLALVTALVWLSTCFVQCCCWRSKDIDYDVGASGQRSIIWTVMLVFFLILAVIFSCVGLAYNSKLSDGLTGGSAHSAIMVSNNNQSLTFAPYDMGSVGVTTAAIQTLDDLNTYFKVFPQLINNLRGIIANTVPLINANIDSATGIVSEFESLLGTMTGTVTTITNVNYFGYSCQNSSSCVSLLAPLNGLIAQVNDVVLPVLDVIDNDIDKIKSVIVEQQQSIDNGLRSAITEINDIHKETTDYQDTADDVVHYVNKYDKDRFAVTVAIFILPLVTMILVAVAYLLRSSALFKLSFHSICFVMIVMWLIFGLHLAVTSGVADSCQFAKTHQRNLNGDFDSQVSAVLEACLLNTSLVTAVNITNSLSFAFSVAIPNVTSTEQIFNISQLQLLSTTVNGLTIDTFGYNRQQQTQARQAALVSLNQLTSPDSFTESTIGQCNPNNYPSSKRDQITAYKSLIVNSLQAQSLLTSTLTGFQQNVSNAVTQAHDIQAQADTILQAFVGVGTIIAPVINAGQLVIGSAYCGTLGDDYGAAKHSLCEPVLYSSGLIDLSAFLIALFLIPVLVAVCVKARQYDTQAQYHAAMSSPSVTAASTSPVILSTLHNEHVGYNEKPVLVQYPVYGAAVAPGASAPPLPSRRPAVSYSYPEAPGGPGSHAPAAYPTVAPSQFTGYEGESATVQIHE